MRDENCWYQNRLEAAGWILFAALLLAAFPLAFHRTTRPINTDFCEFYCSAKHVWDWGTRSPDTKFSHYLPSIDAAAAPVMALPLCGAATVWFAAMTLAWLGLVAAARRYLLCGVDAVQARRSVLVAALLVMPIFLDHLCVGAFHVLMVWFLVAGLGRISQGRSKSGAAMLGLAIWIKLLPLLAVGYLLLKRKWTAAVVALATAIVVDAALSLAAFGPATAWRLHREWWTNQARGESNRILTSVRPLDADRLNNQSPMIVMRRLLTHMGEGDAHDRAEAARRGVAMGSGDVGSVDDGGVRPGVAVADLTPGQLRAVYFAAMTLLALALAFYCRRPGRATTPRRWGEEIALVTLATLWFTPYVWSYHVIAVLPAMAVIFGRAPQRPRTAVATGVFWTAATALMGSNLARAVGVTLGMNFLLGAILVLGGTDDSVADQAAGVEGGDGNFSPDGGAAGPAG